MDQTQGSFNKNGPERYINDFFISDFISSPRYRQDEQAAAKLMQMRLDSRGSPLRRTYLGNLDQYMQGQSLIEKKAREALNCKKASAKLSQGGHNIIQSQVLPSVGVSPRLGGIMKQSNAPARDTTESSRN